jgi:hypothetical protein
LHKSFRNFFLIYVSTKLSLLQALVGKQNENYVSLEFDQSEFLCKKLVRKTMSCHNQLKLVTPEADWGIFACIIGDSDAVTNGNCDYLSAAQ